MKKSVAVCFIILTVVFSVGCSANVCDMDAQIIKHNYVYQGDNEFWSAEYWVNGEGKFTKANGHFKYESWYDNKLTVVYKKNLSDLSKIRNFEIEMKTSTGTGSRQMQYTEDGLRNKVFTLHSRGSGCIESKDEVIKVTVTINGQSQSLDLKNIESVSDPLKMILRNMKVESRKKLFEKKSFQPI